MPSLARSVNYPLWSISQNLSFQAVERFTWSCQRGVAWRWASLSAVSTDQKVVLLINNTQDLLCTIQFLYLWNGILCCRSQQEARTTSDHLRDKKREHCSQVNLPRNTFTVRLSQLFTLVHENVEYLIHVCVFFLICACEWTELVHWSLVIVCWA